MRGEGGAYNGASMRIQWGCNRGERGVAMWGYSGAATAGCGGSSVGVQGRDATGLQQGTNGI